VFASLSGMAKVPKVNAKSNLTRIRSRAVKVFDGDRQASEQWLSTPQVGLGGARPSELARTAEGVREVEQLLTRIDRGVYA
jgi:putative toxin-antitoxin system antitoxin component (TIGR02293 family)